MIMAFLGNLILAPIINALSKFVTGPQAVPMSDMTWIVQSIWTILIIMEILCIISFLAVIGRSNEVGYDQYY
jgi:hypothetical protein